MRVVVDPDRCSVDAVGDHEAGASVPQVVEPDRWVDAEVIEVHPGHASYGITMDRYGHLYRDATAVVDTALNAARGVANAGG